MRFYIGLGIGIALGFMAGTALAAQSELPIRARIIQCGTMQEAQETCKASEKACCAFAVDEQKAVIEYGDQCLSSCKDQHCVDFCNSMTAQRVNEIEPSSGDTDGHYIEPERVDGGEIVNFE